MIDQKDVMGSFEPVEYVRKKFFLSVIQVARKKNSALLLGVEITTFWLLVQVLYH